MHHALLIHEILEIILQYFTLQDEDFKERYKYWRLRLYRRTLAYLARTCKALSDPALDVLWARQSSLMPVLKLLPQFQMIGNGYYDIVSPIEPEQWDRFMSYAARIRIFTFTADGRLLPSVYERVFRKVTRPHVFPSLQRMIWSRDCPLNEDALLGFVSPSLRIADIQASAFPRTDNHIKWTTGEDSEKRVLDLLFNSLLTVSMQLQCLKVGVTLTPNIESSIAQFTSIETLDLSTAGSWRNVDTFYALGRMPNLIELRINTTNIPFDDSTPPSLLFNFLKSLSLTGSPATIEATLAVVSSTTLGVLQLATVHTFCVGEWKTCLSMLPRHIVKSLTEFRLECVRGLTNLSDIPTPAIDIVSPMMAATDLRKVSFELEGPLRASDADITQMISAWPHLREFHLWFHRSGDGPTLQSLTSCAAIGQGLEVLKYPMNARNGLAASAPEKPCPSLKWLEFMGNTPTVQEEQYNEEVGKLVHRIFPNLQQLDVYSRHYEEDSMWAIVKRNIPSLRIKTNR
ncbi:hypothetical protein BXZ70DRAFT_1006388 [Cristinia sonorae]|uniref:F-box domain-containing protein n=1 Tax=Cristinia sonorae TaxID=1940300 RepID=A0A8K0XRI2_9AGAR|nr:hypothetical protein BXZ70DRAFT_1006388 [Cristinia sonorae]